MGVDPGITAVRFVKGSTVFHVHGDGRGQEGVWLAQGEVKGLYDAPVKTTWKTGAFQDGSKQKHRKWLHRDMDLGFHVKETISETYELNDSEFRKIFDYELDPWEDPPQVTTCEVETVLSGVRNLDVLMYETPDFVPKVDSLKNQHGLIVLKLRGGQPMWYEADVVSSFNTNTTSGSGTVTVSNPTDQIMRQKWVLTQATWTLPDFQWVGGRGARVPGGTYAARTVSGITVTAGNGGAVVDLDRQELMFRDANDTNILAQLAGKFFKFAIPPYTPPTTLPVSYTGAPSGGAMVQLVQPRRWSRPWGLEA